MLETYLPFATIAALTILLVVIIVVDVKHQIIPDTLNAALAWLGVVHIAVFLPINFWAWHAATAAVLAGLGAFFAGPYSKWRKRDMLGWGDVKFFAAAGIWLALPSIAMFLILAGVFGIVGALIYKARTGRAETPFAPALCVALWLTVMHSSRLIDLDITRLF